MGLFDSVAGAVLGKLGGQQGGVAQIALDMFNQYGGVNGVLDKLKENGLADEAASWVSTGANIPVNADQITNALGSGAVAEMAAKLGIDPADLSAKIAEHLPTVIDKMTPNGMVEEGSGNLLSTVLAMFK
ncbi:MAG TPA: YidB family protein [Methylophilus sp.]|nr:YidB family protein [Methylophilus sp.]HQQ32372.1 YidB family protein [Methylophilus sp.]